MNETNTITDVILLVFILLSTVICIAYLFYFFTKKIKEKDEFAYLKPQQKIKY